MRFHGCEFCYPFSSFVLFACAESWQAREQISSTWLVDSATNTGGDEVPIRRFPIAVTVVALPYFLKRRAVLNRSTLSTISPFRAYNGERGWERHIHMSMDRNPQRERRGTRARETEPARRCVCVWGGGEGIILVFLCWVVLHASDRVM